MKTQKQFGLDYLIWENKVNLLLTNYCETSNVVLKQLYNSKLASYNVQKVSTFCPTENKIPSYQSSNVIYNNCPGCAEDYIGNSECCFGIRMEFHGKRDNEPMFNHLRKCNQFQELCNFLVIDDEQDNRSNKNMNNYIYNTVLNNSKILKRHNNSIELSFIETYFIKPNNPSFNVRISASKELVLFK